MNEILKNKLSIGLSLDISLEEYKILFEKYKYYIHDIYFSLPLGDKYHSRSKIAKQFLDKENVNKFYDILALARSYGIKLDCVLNRPTLTSDMIEGKLDYIYNLNVDQITCLDCHIDVLKDKFKDIPIIYSFNNDFSIDKLDNISKLFSTIVVGKTFLRNIDELSMIHDLGFNIKLLVNNGCSFNCLGCQSGNKDCYKVFRKNLEKYGIDYLYALQSFFPFELDLLLKGIDFPIESIKISNRTDNCDYLNKCIESYVGLKEPKDYIKEDNINFRLWARTGNFNKYYDQINFDNVMKIKEKNLILH